MRLSRGLYLGVSLAALWGGAGSSAFAQAAPPPAPEAASSSAVAEIVVTARRREERLQDVPLSIAAFNNTQLAQQGGSSLSDIAALTPGLNFEAYANGGYPVLTIRGLAQTNILGFENNVASFFGGVYLPRAYMVDVGLAGLERVEVVKGPQSALYGRNAFAGAVNYVPKAPPNKFTFEAFGTAGTNKRYDYSATVGGPIIQDRLSAIGGFVHTQFDGTWKNAHPNAGVDANGTTDRMGGYDNDAYFAAITVTPIDRLKVTFGYNHSEKDTESSGRYGISRNTGGTNCSLAGGVYQFYCGTLPVRQAIVDPRSQGLHSKSDIYRLDAGYDINENFAVRYLFGYVRSKVYSYDMADVNSLTGDQALGVRFLGLPVGSLKGPSHDLRLEYKHAGTNIAVGGYASDLDDDSKTLLSYQPPLGVTPISPSTPGQITAQSGITRIENRSIFAQASQDFMDKRFNISAEGRYAEETKTLDDKVVKASYAAKFTFFTPRLVAKWNFSPNGNVYVSAARGVKSGGFNSGNILASERAFRPETNWTYELGAKVSFLDRRIVLDAAVFYIDWKQLQTLGQSGNSAFVGTITRNIGGAKAPGFETNATIKITTGLTGNLAFSYTDPKYADGLIDPRYLLITSRTGQLIKVCDGITCPANGSIGGNTLPRESKTQASGGLRYDGRMEVLGGSDYWIGANLSYKSKQYVDPLLLTTVPSRTLVDAFGGVSTGRVSIEGWVKNMFDKKYVSSSTYNLSPPGEIRYEVALGERRTAGLTLRYKY